MNRLILAGWMLVLGICGCAVDAVEVGEDTEPLGQTEQPIVDGTLTNKRGVVEMEVDGVKCTGVMINSQYILTATRCVDADFEGVGGGEHFLAMAKVSYFDPDLDDGKKRTVTGNILNTGLDFVYVDTWTFGLALVSRDAGWIGTGITDYQRLSQGDCNLITFSTLYGRGSGGPGTGNGAGVLRSVPAIGWDCEIIHFGGDFGANDDAALCPGDYGAPLMMKVGSYDVVTGITHMISGDPTVCSGGGDEWGAMRFNAAIDWIQGITDNSCHTFVVDGHEYYRCWDT